MLHLLRRHPMPIEAHFDDCLVLTYALPAERLTPLLPRGLELDSWRGWGFVAVAMVQTRNLRPAGLPAWAGRDFFLAGYRIFARYRTSAGRTLRGLRILRSDTDRAAMACFGNLLTHYNYRTAQVGVERSDRKLEVRVLTLDGTGDLHVVAELSEAAAPLPAESVFADAKEARRFAGPLPYTFDYEAETDSIVLIKGVRQQWEPRPTEVRVRRCSFLERGVFAGSRPILSAAFHLSGVDYRWERGRREPLAGRLPCRRAS